MAPRVHNSGHWTIEGAVCSQFEKSSPRRARTAAWQHRRKRQGLHAELGRRAASRNAGARAGGRALARLPENVAAGA